MRKLFILTSVIILSLVLTGCGIKNQPSKQNEATNQTANNVQNPENSPAKPNDGSVSNQTAGKAEIVAKSENIISSSEKEVLLNQVDKELDSLFSNINNLEDPQDTDLDLNQ